MPYRLAQIAAALEVNLHIVRHHDDDERFNRTTPDTEWLSALGTDNMSWIVVTGDAAILKKPIERNALSEANLTFFVMAKMWSKMGIYDYAWKFLKTWPNILKAAQTIVPTIFEVGGGQSLKVEPVELTKKKK